MCAHASRQAGVWTGTRAAWAMGAAGNLRGAQVLVVLGARQAVLPGVHPQELESHLQVCRSNHASQLLGGQRVHHANFINLY